MCSRYQIERLKGQSHAYAICLSDLFENMLIKNPEELIDSPCLTVAMECINSLKMSVKRLSDAIDEEEV